MPRDAEAWLAERGVRRDPIRVEVPGPPGAPDIGAREAVDLARQAANDRIAAAGTEPAGKESAGDPGAAEVSPGPVPLADEVARAVAFVRRSTSAAPQAEGRLREKLAERGFSTGVVDSALERARRERLVDDRAMAASLVAERRSAGHALARIRRDLRARGFDDDVLDVVLAEAEAEDPEAAAFAVASRRARQLSGLEIEAAFRRVVGHVVRRGYPDGLARKVARQAVFATRDDERIAGR